MELFALLRLDQMVQKRPVGTSHPNCCCRSHFFRDTARCRSMHGTRGGARSRRAGCSGDICKTQASQEIRQAREEFREGERKRREKLICDIFPSPQHFRAWVRRPASVPAKTGIGGWADHGCVEGGLYPWGCGLSARRRRLARALRDLRNRGAAKAPSLVGWCKKMPCGFCGFPAQHSLERGLHRPPATCG